MGICLEVIHSFHATWAGLHARETRDSQGGDLKGIWESVSFPYLSCFSSWSPFSHPELTQISLWTSAASLFLPGEPASEAP